MRNENMDEQDFIELKALINQRFNHLDDRLHRMEITFLGDEEMGNPGHIKKHRDLEEQVKQNSAILHDNFIERFNETEERSKENKEKISKIWAYGTFAVAIAVFLVEAGIRLIG